MPLSQPTSHQPVVLRSLRCVPLRLARLDRPSRARTTLHNTHTDPHRHAAYTDARVRSPPRGVRELLRALDAGVPQLDRVVVEREAGRAEDALEEVDGVREAIALEHLHSTPTPCRGVRGVHTRCTDRMHWELWALRDEALRDAP